eukprot:jgi/Galph1/5879/GphlegSOOS_G4536.1
MKKRSAKTLTTIFSFLFLLFILKKLIFTPKNVVKQGVEGNKDLWNLYSMYHWKDFQDYPDGKVLHRVVETFSTCYKRLVKPQIIRSRNHPNKVDLFVCLLLHKNEDSLVRGWVYETVLFFKELRTRGFSIFLSIIEDGCSTFSKNLLRTLSKFCQEVDISFEIILADKFIEFPHRIYTLSTIRNCALLHLLTGKIEADQVLIFNDVLYRAERLSRLFFQLNQSYDMKCGVDYFINGNSQVQLYDLWVTRTMDGKLPRAIYPFFEEDEESYLQAKPFRSYCCWGGVAILNGSLFSEGLRFRGFAERPTNGYHEAECPHSENGFLCDDIWNMRENANLIIDPAMFANDLKGVESFLQRLHANTSLELSNAYALDNRSKPKQVTCCPWIEGLSDYAGATTICYSSYPLYKLPERPIKS